MDFEDHQTEEQKKKDDHQAEKRLKDFRVVNISLRDFRVLRMPDRGQENDFRHSYTEENAAHVFRLFHYGFVIMFSYAVIYNFIVSSRKWKTEAYHRFAIMLCTFCVPCFFFLVIASTVKGREYLEERLQGVSSALLFCMFLCLFHTTAYNGSVHGGRTIGLCFVILSLTSFVFKLRFFYSFATCWAMVVYFYVVSHMLCTMEYLPTTPGSPELFRATAQITIGTTIFNCSAFSMERLIRENWLSHYDSHILLGQKHKSHKRAKYENEKQQFMANLHGKSSHRNSSFWNTSSK